MYNMFYMKRILVFLTVCGLAFTLNAQNNIFSPDNWTLTLAGVGSTTVNADATSVFGGQIGLGHEATILLPGEIGVRQTFAYSDESTLGNTTVYSDWTVLEIRALEFQVGGNVGITYGDTTALWTVSPEAIVKYNIKDDVWMFGRLEYPYDLNNGESLDNLIYTIGIGCRF